jgi:hypothetical protein
MFKIVFHKNLLFCVAIRMMCNACRQQHYFIWILCNWVKIIGEEIINSLKSKYNLIDTWRKIVLLSSHKNFRGVSVPTCPFTIMRLNHIILVLCFNHFIMYCVTCVTCVNRKWNWRRSRYSWKIDWEFDVVLSTWGGGIGLSKLLFFVDKHNSVNVRAMTCGVRIGWTTNWSTVEWVCRKIQKQRVVWLQYQHLRQ